MIESLRTMQIAFLRFATPSGFLGGWRRGTKSMSCKGLCKGKSYETICENIVSQYQTLVSSLPGGTVFLHRRPNKVYFKSTSSNFSACEKVFPKKSVLNRTCVHVSMLKKKIKTAWECITYRRRSSWYQFKTKESMLQLENTFLVMFFEE